jgi:hypothetical protein
VSAVVPVVSKGGDTSTRSQPTSLTPASPRTIWSACQSCRPPISWVPVPVASPGARLSMSKLR